MDSDPEEAEVFSDAGDPAPLRVEEEGEEEGDDEDDDEDEDAHIFSAWMQRCRGGERQKKTGEEEEEEGDSEGGRSSEVPVPVRTDRRASLPCPVRKPAAKLVFELLYVDKWHSTRTGSFNGHNGSS